MYFENLKGTRNDYLLKSPTKAGVLNNAIIDGARSILPESNNRALKIETPDAIFLQSYDTLILKYDKNAGVIYKMWFDYSTTTLKHVNIFMREYTGALNTFNKKEWEKFEKMNV